MRKIIFGTGTGDVTNSEWITEYAFGLMFVLQTLLLLRFYYVGLT